MESDTPESGGAPGSEVPGSGSPGAGDQPAARRIEIGSVEGDLTVRGSDSPQVVVNTDDDDEDEDDRPAPSEAGDGGVLRFSTLPSDTELIVPHTAILTIRRVEGDLHAEQVGSVSVGRVDGDVELTGVMSMDLGRVAGDLRAAGGGALRVREIEGDASLDALGAPPTLGRIDGELEVRGVPGLEVREGVGGEVTLEGCGQDAVLRGPIGGDLRAEGCGGLLRVNSVGGDLRVRTTRALLVDGVVSGDCEVAEIAGDVEVRGAVGGDLRASLVGGLNVAGAVGGDGDLATIGRAVTVRTVGGSLSADALGGPLTAGTVGGNLRLRTCLGAIDVRMVGGDLTVQQAVGGVSAARVGGDAVVDTPLTAGATYQVRASGDVSLRVQGEVNARFVAQTQGGEIRTRLPLAVERGRRRNLVGVLGRGDATVTLNSDGGDIYIAAADGNEEETMGDDFVGKGTATDEAQGSAGPRSWEGRFGGHRFRVRWDPGASDPAATEDPDGVGAARRGFGFEWEHNPEEDRKTADDFERRMNDLRDKAENVARRAAEQAQRYAERAARRARETDWESVGREVRSAIERAMSDLEEAIGQVRGEFESRRGPGGGRPDAGSRPSGAQRVRIERDDEGDAFTPGYGGEYGGAGAGAPPTVNLDTESQRRAILEQLRSGAISLDEAERRLGELR